jgi:hypothetical protein
MAKNAALHKANAPTNVTVMLVRQNMTGNLLLTPAPNSSVQELLHHADTISAAISSVNPSLQPPRPVEKWHKLAIHRVPTELYPDTEEGMQALQADIEQQNYVVQLTQLPRYMSHPDKRAGKAASSIIIAGRTHAEADKVKRTRINVNYAPRQTTDYYSSHPTDQCQCCQKLGHHQATCKADNGPIWRFCTEVHPTDKHSYSQYPSRIGKSCAHTTYKCANCIEAGNEDTNHAAFNPCCPIKAKAIRDAWQKNRTPSTPEDPPMDITMTTNE